LPQDWEEKERAQQEAEAALARETDWVMTWNRDLRTGVLRPGFALKKTLEWEQKHREWEHYAEYLVERLPSGGDQAALAQAQKELTDAIKGDFEAWLAKNGVVEFPPEAVDVFANYFVAETFAAAGQPVTVPTPPPGFWGASTPAVPTPDTGWIENYVQAVGEQWVDEGYGVEAVVPRTKAFLPKPRRPACRDEAIVGVRQSSADGRAHGNAGGGGDGDTCGGGDGDARAEPTESPRRRPRHRRLSHADACPPHGDADASPPGQDVINRPATDLYDPRRSRPTASRSGSIRRAGL
jgi:hypothetical protein